MSEDRATYRAEAAMGETLHADAVAQLRAEIAGKSVIPPLTDDDAADELLSRLRADPKFEDVVIDRVAPNDVWGEKDGWRTLLERDPSPQWRVRVYVHDGFARRVFEGQGQGIVQTLRSVVEDALAWRH